ncbi:Serine/threonine protein phosphatase 2A 57 kDa regulatory subunit B' iota isoform [Hibiscus syriacus]|uniref:Serine/threonine protein phosphatase 2A regulatory subunit n=1 Tax=Hibiscus syriacus TaxID=106335 RepID=A0A6A2ZI08_HIBSY|nr:serine/threonine protein phosphatase 2A 57 kDa regulatory subunit B' kappa isoform-like [Hibiscus syriacus]KAE8691343.1 Serine/threonine protein phosphatase 2A 57 kDa regulatory subunit B' iota isoform [Hibiscus syriacus]
MLRQFLSKIPRNFGNSDSPEIARSNSYITAGSHIHRSTSFGPGIGRPCNTKRTSSAIFPASVVAGVEPLLPFKSAPNSEKMNLFVSKVSLCCVTFDFSDATKNSIEKDVKRQILLELLDFVNSGSIIFSEPAILALCRMCSTNLFRVFPPNYRSISSSSGEPDDDDPVFCSAWPHLQIVYDLLLKFITSPCLDAKIAKKYIDHSFILKLLDLFDSEDPKERECLKSILHRVYGKFMVHRPLIRKDISNIFCRFIFEMERHNGISELLEIFGSIISGFALPLKEEHKIFLQRVLIPLHKPKSLGVYFNQLSYCVTQFIDKDPSLSNVVIKGLLKYWPITNSQKEVMFLDELKDILEETNMVEFQKVMVPLFSRIGRCINSLHFQVAERALLLWNKDQFFNLIVHNRHVILPIILPALERNAQSHWNPSILNLTLNVRRMFMDMDRMFFMSCHIQFKDVEAKQRKIAEKQEKAWQRIENAANLRPITRNTNDMVTPLDTSISS